MLQHFVYGHQGAEFSLLAEQMLICCRYECGNISIGGRKVIK